MKLSSIKIDFLRGKQNGPKISGGRKTGLPPFAIPALSAALGATLFSSFFFLPVFRSGLVGSAASSGIQQTAGRRDPFHSPGEGVMNTRASMDLSITLVGSEQIQEECGNSFNDPGATAVNSRGDTVAVVASGTVDTGNPGSYEITYTAVEGQKSVSVVRTVTVVDTVPPSIVLDGGNPMIVSCGRAFIEPGATANDNCQGSVPVTISGSVDENVPGTYVISYSAKDKYDNARTVTRTVIVGSIEANPPTITLNGEPQMTLECGDVFSDPGATAADPCSGALLVESSGTVDVSSLGTYAVTYSATFMELRAEASRAVSIVDTTAPVISLKGDNPLMIEVHQTFTDPGATARDGCVGNFAATATGIVDPNTIGSYTITYSAKDPSGNEATPLRRTVNVIDKKQSTAITKLWPVIEIWRWLISFI